MEDTSLNEKGSGNLKNYNNNKDIKVRKKRTTKSKPDPTTTPLPLTEKEIWTQWVIDNRVQFMNSGKKSNEFITNVYKAYNAIFDSNKSRGKCGICDWNIILELKGRFF